MKITRRTMLRGAGAAAGLWLISRPEHLLAQPATAPATQPQFSTARYKVAVCDWMLNKRQKLGAISWAKRCGMDGVEVVMGIETMLDVEQSKKFLDDVASPSVKLYYNLGLGLERGGDIYEEIRQLGKDRICMIHCKEEDGHWLGEPGAKIDLPKLKSALD